jgi:propionyl-CoA carboxylase alpha chain
MNHDSFRSGNFDTHFVKHHFKPEYLNRPLDLEEEKAAVLLASALKDAGQNLQDIKTDAPDLPSLWKINRR